MTTTIARLLLLLVALGVAGCDQASKGWAERSLDGAPPVEVISGRLDISYTKNPGMAFSAERALPAPVRTPLLIGAALAVLAAMGAAWVRHRGRPGFGAIGAAVIAGGAAGNLTDRFVRGYVVDFIHWHGWPVFNVADVALLVGGGLLVIAAIRMPRPA
jgi:signal peptidase II